VYRYKLMSIVALLLILVAMIAILTVPVYKYGRGVDKASNNDALYAQLYDSIYLDNEKFEREMRLLSTPEGSYVLDVGCGTGDRVGKVAHAVGVDVSPHMVAMAEKKYPKKTFVVGDVLKKGTFKAETFTEVWCLGNSLYCLPEKMRFLQNAHRWLDPNGTLVLELMDRARFCVPSPYPKNFYYDLKRMGNTCRERVKFQKEKAVVETTFYPISSTRMIDMAERVGFKVERKEGNFTFFKKAPF
jgi:ubiquinone/menaquinone biosynthesis C-methylase UbiE